MRVLIACEFSGIVREAFNSLGHDAWSCDLLPSEIDGKHIQDDCLNHLDANWDLAIFHPPCTYLCNSGVRWLYRNGKGQEIDKQRWIDMESGANFFLKLLNAPIPKIAIENPIMHKYAQNIIHRKQDQIIQPWMFGHEETKATCLWLKGLPKLIPNNIVDGRNNRVHKETPGIDRWKRRSRTLEGIAEAMAKQWGGYNVRNK